MQVDSQVFIFYFFSSPWSWRLQIVPLIKRLTQQEEPWHKSLELFLKIQQSFKKEEGRKTRLLLDCIPCQPARVYWSVSPWTQEDSHWRKQKNETHPSSSSVCGRSRRGFGEHLVPVVVTKTGRSTSWNGPSVRLCDWEPRSSPPCLIFRRRGGRLSAQLSAEWNNQSRWVWQRPRGQQQPWARRDVAT